MVNQPGLAALNPTTYWKWHSHTEEGCISFSPDLIPVILQYKTPGSTPVTTSKPIAELHYNYTALSVCKT